MIRKILIANRGEIAVRVIRTAREMGIATVAVYSDADRDSMFVQLADEAIALGGNSAAESYLVMDKILEAAKSTGANAIHPGYGFLSERPEFVRRCTEAGIIFIGPSAESMQRLGGKIEAKQIAVKGGVPVTPGFFEPGATNEQLIEAAKKIGFPLMLKASAGGGGRGMRAVYSEAELESQLEQASNEALASFGDGAMMVEKLVQEPRHVEVQIIADKHGNVAPLFERECSIQRRHQKLIEEAPSPYVSAHPQMWDAMREASVRLAHAAEYYGAGTVEFIVEPSTGEFYFLEVNARLQVEHPVTEQITGLDLVRLQIEVANGASLADLIPEFLSGDRARISGHSMEIRLVAEDPAKNFAPSLGKILAWLQPEGPGIRIDTGFGKGSEVTPFYDSMLAKVIVSGPDRAAVLARMDHALNDFHVLGVRTNVPFILEVLRDGEFSAGKMDTGFIARKFADWKDNAELPPELASLAKLAAPSASGSSKSENVGSFTPAWGLNDGFRSTRVGNT